MLKWPNLYYSTSAFAPKHYPEAIIRYANTRGARTKSSTPAIFPMGLTLERIMSDMDEVPLPGRGVAEIPARQRPQGAEALDPDAFARNRCER